MMHLHVMQPTEVLVNQPVAKVVAEDREGNFCLLPQHVDLVVALVPGILTFALDTGEEVFLAIDDGILVKQGATVWVSVRNAVRGNHLETLRQKVQQQFHHLDDREQQARQMLARLETSFVRELIDLGGHP
jgi:F-type H+-transporting ATPase subunit epsilon